MCGCVDRTSYLYPWQTDGESHSLSWVRTSGQSCPPLAGSWMIILFLFCFFLVLAPEENHKKMHEYTFVVKPSSDKLDQTTNYIGEKKILWPHPDFENVLKEGIKCAQCINVEKMWWSPVFSVIFSGSAGSGYFKEKLIQSGRILNNILIICFVGGRGYWLYGNSVYIGTSLSDCNSECPGDVF